LIQATLVLDIHILGDGYDPSVDVEAGIREANEVRDLLFDKLNGKVITLADKRKVRIVGLEMHE
jgi:hypothetical protein